MSHMFRYILLILCLIVLIGCSTPETTGIVPTKPLPESANPSLVVEQPEVAATTSTSAPAIDQTSTIPPQPTSTTLPALAAEPQRITFKSEDGVELVGYYYPAAVNPAPVVVLMHWAGGTQCDWVEVNLVQWLQNRDLAEGVAANPACKALGLPQALQLSDYPDLPDEQSLAVFSFDFRNFGESEKVKGDARPFWIKDAIRAVQTAQGLPGIDPERLATIGASIGADGAIDACEEGCLGALSYSPGNYLGLEYDVALALLAQAKKSAWCVAAQDDTVSYLTCDSANNEGYRKILYPGDSHGLLFFQKGFDPHTPQVVVDFLQLVFSE